MTSVTIYHNPRCSKSRQTLELLQARRLDINIVRYLESPPDAATLKDIIRQLGVSAMDIVRTGEDEYKTSGLSGESTEDEVISAIVTLPKLLQRPIVVSAGRARIGRPPESVLEILQ